MKEPFPTIGALIAVGIMSLVFAAEARPAPPTLAYLSPLLTLAGFVSFAVAAVMVTSSVMVWCANSRRR